MLYPLHAYNYRVYIYKNILPNDSNDLSSNDPQGTAMSFSEVSGLRIEYGISVYQHSMSAYNGPHYSPGEMKPVHLRLKRGIINNTELTYLYNWMKSTQSRQADRRNVLIDLCNESGDVSVSWKVIDAFPVALDAPTFDASGEEIAIESMSLVAHGVQLP